MITAYEAAKILHERCRNTTVPDISEKLLYATMHIDNVIKNKIADGFGDFEFTVKDKGLHLGIIERYKKLGYGVYLLDEFGREGTSMFSDNIHFKISCLPGDYTCPDEPMTPELFNKLWNQSSTNK